MSMNIDRPKVWRHSLIRVYLALEKLEENPTPLFSRLDITLEDLLAKDYWLDAEAFERDDVDKLSGEILYIENRAPVTRSVNQQEDLKVVITL